MFTGHKPPPCFEYHPETQGLWTPQGGSFLENALPAAHDFHPVGRRGHIARLASMEPDILWPERRGAVANLS